ncbi:MAG: phosphatidate cytidylyltransferase [Verrucomicrobiae bacterium]|nr:phosphatidate cytidylyltransferase [Verrucomicrobiae bacterium]
MISTLILWVCVLSVILTDWVPGYYLLFNLVAVKGLLEYYRLHESGGARMVWGCGLLATVLLISGSLWLHRNAEEILAWMWMSGVFTFFSLWVLCASLWRTGDRSSLETVGGSLSGFIYVPWLLNFMVLIAFGIPKMDGSREGGYYLIYLLIVTKFCDMGALLSGMAFGKHKFVPKISPKKTWEGLAGGVVLSILSSFVLVNWIMPGQLSLISWSASLYLGLVLALFSVIGDLAESLLKRGAHLKDSGHVVPGIGGMLDLIDSLLFTGPALYFYLRFVA